MNNIESITNYIRDYTCTVNCDKERVTLKIVNTKTNKNHVRQRNKYQRSYNFIDGAIAYETLEDKLIFYEVGKAIGSFQRRLDEYPINKLHITIPNFHNTPIRYKRFLTDYLQGDTYFSTDYPRHNLDRARAQFKLVEEIEKNYTDLEKIIKSILKNLSPKS